MLTSLHPASIYGRDMASFLRFIGRLVACALALALLAYAGVNGWGWLKARGLRADIRTELTARLADAVPSERAVLERLGALSPAPELSWLAQECSFSTRDSGWIVQSYRQECLLRSVTAWPVADQAEAERLLSAVPLELTGPAVTADEISECRRLRSLPTDVGLDEQAAYYLSPQDSDVYWCGRMFAPGYRHRLFAGTGAELNPARHWLVVTRTEPLGQWELGCQHWSVIFCSNPFGDNPEWGLPPD